MKVIRLNTNPNQYSSSVYLLLGSFNKLDDVNTLIDSGYDGHILNEIQKINTGVGKNPVDQLLLTHNHFDHTGGIAAIREKFKTKSYAFLPSNNIDKLLHDGMEIKAADDYLRVIHTPGHSQDSVCFYNKKDGILFSGDTSIRVYSNDSSFTDEYRTSIEKLARLKIKVVYPGHGGPITEDPEGILRKTLHILSGKEFC